MYWVTTYSFQKMGLRKVILPFSIGKQTWCSSSGVVPSVTIGGMCPLDLFLLSQKTGGQAVVPRAWGCIPFCQRWDNTVKSVHHCWMEDSSLPVGSGMTHRSSTSFRKVFWHLHVPLVQGCKEILHSLTESECHLQDLHAAPRILHLKRMWGTDI